jgi:hypothetical protein
MESTKPPYRRAAPAAAYDPMTLGRRASHLHNLEDCDARLGKGECPMCIAFKLGAGEANSCPAPQEHEEMVAVREVLSCEACGLEVCDEHREQLEEGRGQDQEA